VEAAQPAPRFRITGADLLAAGLAPGPEIGRMLAEIEAGWIAAGLPDSLPAQRALLEARLAAG
ncbi:MAG: CCA tRNA nucleotidyltransferase, partial [Hyphomicrobiales bacterium]|nr:CCA tRNA nucleotidyltransferase [Hyphomicrobiales bacterium]